MTDSTTRRIFRTPGLLLLAGIVAASISRTAHASTFMLTSDCSVTPDTFGCHLLSLLKFLYAAAAVLGLVLVVVIVIAVNSYRKNSRNDERRRG